MLFRVLADFTVIAHLGFVLFVVFGGLLVLRHASVAWLHIPAALWGVWVECAGSTCPLTPLENWLREQGGEVGYTSSFVEHYVIPTLYPEALSRELQYALGASVSVLNAGIYALVWRQRQRRRVPRGTTVGW